MNGMWIVVAAVVAFAALRRGRQGREDSTWFRPGYLFLLAFAFLFLFLGHRGPFRNWHFRMPNLPSIHIPEIASIPSPAVEVHVPRVVQARQQYADSKHKHSISKSAYTSSGKVFSERTTLIDDDGTVIVTTHTSESRAPRTYRGIVAENVGFAVAALIVVAFLYIGYLFLDAGTRGQFTWTLRITSIVAFVVICAVVALLRQRM